ncbi:lytic transglycosylase domain-containing protein [Clostridium aminobutyricum]|uniref:Lytic transglycosylase domain-containing protein n=1 Tax=Clostridium aminobutyricum TaxID=33953 RepID=A0A939DAT5_CLOAM|nr:lytic transglycosylase domain-containing protein [Clostridium aminobutyricum]MBN7774187.1 lytic transglycosylase domain-containing protein [Clostridium aminobutyricum]
MSIENINQITPLNYLNNKTGTNDTAKTLMNFAQVLNQVASGNQIVKNRMDLAVSGSDVGQTTNAALKTDLEELFTRASEAYNVPADLLKAVAKAESGFNSNAVSRCGAMGVMQLMPATAKALGVTDAYDPEQNIMGGAKYLSQKLQAYDGDITLALASYNAGSGNVAKYGGVPPFPETQNYINKVLGYMGQEIEIPERTDWKSNSLILGDILGENSQTFSEMGAEKAYYMSQLQILQHQLEMQELFASNFKDETKKEESYIEKLSEIQNPSNLLIQA